METAGEMLRSCVIREVSLVKLLVKLDKKMPRVWRASSGILLRISNVSLLQIWLFRLWHSSRFSWSDFYSINIFVIILKSQKRGTDDESPTVYPGSWLVAYPGQDIQGTDHVHNDVPTWDLSMSIKSGWERLGNLGILIITFWSSLRVICRI